MKEHLKIKLKNITVPVFSLICTTPFPCLADKNQFQFGIHLIVFVTFENEFGAAGTQLVIWEKQSSRCKIWIENYESQIVRWKNEFENIEIQSVHLKLI